MLGLRGGLGIMYPDLRDAVPGYLRGVAAVSNDFGKTLCPR